MKIFITISALLYTLLYTSIVLPDTEDNLRRLFTTPLERNRIDAIRKNINNTGNTEQAESQKVFVDRIELNGMVIRENGDNVVWVNGQNNLKGNRINEALRVYPRSINKNKSRLPLQVSDQWLRMRPGQVWDGTSGKIVDKHLTKEAKSASGGVVDKQGGDDTKSNEETGSPGDS